MRMEHPYVEDERIAERYLKGQLEANESALFEEHYLTCQACLEQLDLAERFDHAIKGVAQEEVALSVASLWTRLRQSRQMMVGLAAGVLLIVLSGGLGLMTVRRLDGELERSRATVAELERSRATVAELQALRAEPEVNIPLLRLSPVRSAAEETEPVNRLTLPEDLQRLVLSLELEGPAYPRYQLTLVDPDGQVTWQRADVERDPRGALVLIVPADLFASGDSVLRVEGLAAQGEPVPLAPFTFRVVR
ncbi:MAG: hypothetical protein AAF657_10765 [Acidobacteriota bacterium]